MIANLLLFLLRWKKFKQFVPKAKEEVPFPEVRWISNQQTYIVSNTHSVFSLEPMVIGIWFDSPFAQPLHSKSIVQFWDIHRAPAKLLAELDVLVIDSVPLTEGTVSFYQVINTNIHFIHPIQQLLVYRVLYASPTVTFNKFKALAAVFCYPRKVWLVSYSDETHENHFPMDFVGQWEGTNYMLFGLRHSNPTVNHIEKTNRLVVSEVKMEDRERIYQLAKNHASSYSIKNEPTKRSEYFGISILDGITDYKEITVVQSKDLGSHMLFIGKIEKDTTHGPIPQALCHIHYIYAKVQSVV